MDLFDSLKELYYEASFSVFEVSLGLSVDVGLDDGNIYIAPISPDHNGIQIGDGLDLYGTFSTSLFLYPISFMDYSD
jgi:hypothetical protein